MIGIFLLFGQMFLPVRCRSDDSVARWGGPGRKQSFRWSKPGMCGMSAVPRLASIHPAAAVISLHSKEFLG